MLNPNFGSHLPLLIKAFNITKGDVIECGTGYFSTPVLHWLCQYNDRKLLSIENNVKFYIFNKAFHKGTHNVEYVKEWDNITLGDYGLAFIDCRPAKVRKEIARKLKDSVDIIILHDTQKKKKAMRMYEYESIYPLFKYQHHCTKTNTSALSNSVDVDSLLCR
jgi:hypothetical protein